MTSKAPTERNLNEVKRRQTCDACQAVKTRCSRSRPTCARCVAQNIPCHYSVSRRIGRPRRLAPPPSPVSLLHVRRAEEQTPVASQPNSEFPCVNQPTGRFYAADWSGGVDVDLDGERMIIDVCRRNVRIWRWETLLGCSLRFCTANSITILIGHRWLKSGNGTPEKPR